MLKVKSLLKNTAFPWVVLFVLSIFFVPQRGGDNTYARLVTMRSITESHTLTMDKYLSWSDDWSLSPNGHYYSDKAPGSALFGLPLLAAFDAPALLNKPSSPLPLPGYWAYQVLVQVMQVLPYAMLVLFLTSRLQAAGIATPALHFFALAALFGCTTSLYMAPYSGHGLAAWLFLLGFYAWENARYRWAGLLLMAAALTDYAVVMTIPALGIATIYREKKRSPQAVWEVFQGALPMLLIWGWYHTVTFGGPFRLAAGYPNPANQTYDPTNHHEGPRHLLASLPYPHALAELFFGSKRGLLFTQAWALVILSAAPFLKQLRLLALTSLGAVAGAIWLNASVLVWAAGHSAGPRYIAFVLPLLGYLAARAWPHLSCWNRGLLWLGLAPALILRALVFPFNERAPIENLWAYYLRLNAQAWMGEAWSAPQTKLLLFLAGILAATAFAYFNQREKKA